MLGCKYGRDYVIEGNMDQYNQLINFIESNDISSLENFNYIQSQVDINQLLNYQILQIYSANGDWPQNNYKLWKPNSDNGKWRWIIHDMDGGFGLAGDSSFLNNNNLCPSNANPPDTSLLLVFSSEIGAEERKFLSSKFEE